MNIWLDDERPAPEGWLWAKTTDEVIYVLQKEDVDWLSLDHDLGMDDVGNMYDSGIAVLEWLEFQQKGEDNDLWPEVVSIHSANPVGRQNMARIINASGLYSYGQMVDINGYSGTKFTRQDDEEFDTIESSVDDPEFLSNDLERYDVYVHNDLVFSASTISVALEEHRRISRETRSFDRFSSVVKIYDNFSKQWIR